MSFETPLEVWIVFGALWVAGLMGRAIVTSLRKRKDITTPELGRAGTAAPDSSEDYRVTPGQLHQFPLYPLCD
jgi:hypothetical protein